MVRMRSTVFLREREGRDHAGRVARVHARVLDVLHHARDDRSPGPAARGEVGDDVDVDLDAPSRNLSMSTGAPSRSLMLRALVMKWRSAFSSGQISMPRPPST
jgi:hypothetical protein